MDYLDPEKRKLRRRRIMYGYALIGLMIGIATLVLVFVANGYFVTKQGEIIQNGLLYVDVDPRNATLYLNGKNQQESSRWRLVIPEGDYDIRIERDGYQSWQHDYRVNGGELRRVAYPRLIPQQLDVMSTSGVDDVPIAYSQSIDKRWLAYALEDDPLQVSIVDLESDSIRSTTVAVPPSLVQANDTDGSIELIEWAEDNKHILARYTTDGAEEFLLIDRESGLNTRNLTDIIAENQSNYEFTLRDGRHDEYFVFDTELNQVLVANLQNGLEPKLLIDGVSDYATYGNNWILYIHDSELTDTQQEAQNAQTQLKRRVEARFIYDLNAEPITVQSLEPAKNYYLNLSKYDGVPVMAVQSAAESKAYVYKDPAGYLQANQESTLPAPVASLPLENPHEITLSADSSVIMSHNSQEFYTYEFEDEQSHAFTTSVSLKSDQKRKINWISGRHFVLVDENGDQYMIDYDGYNTYKITSSTGSMPLLSVDDGDAVCVIVKYDAEKTPVKPSDEELLQNAINNFVGQQSGETASPYVLQKISLIAEADR